MLFDPGPLTLLDPERIMPPRLTFGFEALAAGHAAQLAGAGDRLASHQARMGEDLAHDPDAGLGEPLTRAIEEHASQVGGELPDLTPEIGGAEALDRDIDIVTGDIPFPGPRPDLPPLEPAASGAFDETVWLEAGGAVPGEPAPGPEGPVFLPAGGAGGGPLEGSEAVRALAAYVAENPNEGPRVERFLRDNPGDHHRAPGALGLPGWAEFLARWRARGG